MSHDIIIIGAGASGLMCAITAAARGKSVLILDHAEKPGKKLEISGGGYCNLTNSDIDPKVHFICQNPYFPISALKRYNQWDFLDFLDKHKIAYEERGGGCYFMLERATKLVDLFMSEARKNGVKLHFREKIRSVSFNNDNYVIKTEKHQYEAEKIVVATGGPSIPKIGASGYGFRLAAEFGHNIIKPIAALVPFTFDPHPLLDLAGASFDAEISAGGRSFYDAILITHRGISGPATLQASSYWNHGEEVTINLFSKENLSERLISAKKSGSNKTVLNELSGEIPKRVIKALAEMWQLNLDKPISKTTHPNLELIAEKFTNWKFIPHGTEGLKTAEVTRGGVDTNEVSSKTFESQLQKNLYFIGEVLDVTGHLGGYNLQWAWASGYCCGQNL